MPRSVIDNGGVVSKVIKIDFTNVDGDVVRAGTPIAADGTIQNNGKAIGILLEDVIRRRPLASVCVGGYIDMDVIRECACMELTDECKRAMPNIWFDDCGCRGGADWSVNDPSAAGYIKNRTHYEAVETVNEPLNITWDGNTEGLVSVGDVLFKVSDLVLTDEQIKSATVGLSSGTTIVVNDQWDAMVVDGSITEDAVVVNDESTNVPTILFVRKAGLELYGMAFNEAGIYAIIASGIYTTSFTTTEPVEQTKTVVHKLDKKYLPDDVGGSGGGGVITVGVRMVDTSGTNFEADMAFEEITAAIEAGKVVQLVRTNTSSQDIYHLCYVGRDSIGGKITFVDFAAFFPGETSLTYSSFGIDSAETVYRQSIKLTAT